MNKLKEPVHPVLYKETAIHSHARRKGIKDGKFHLPVLPMADLPKEEVQTFGKLSFPKNNLQKQTLLRSQVSRWHQKLKTVEPLPPCHECKTAVCCKAKIINLTKEEFESGLYGDYAVEMPERVGREKLPPSMKYILDKTADEPCPFLNSNNQCGIYDYRPAVCRVYTCLQDPHITPEMREEYDY